MWKQHLLFSCLALFGLGSLGVYLLPSDRIEQPQTFDARRTAKQDFGTVVEQVNAEFDQYWTEAEIDVAPRAPDLIIARRLSLGLTGTIPSLEEIRAFEKQRPENRIEWWVSRLLEDRRYSDYVAERLARAYVGTENGPFLIYRRRRFVTWLSDRIHENKPYNEIVRHLISDTGLWTSSPAVNFTTVTVNQDESGQPDPVRLAGRTTRAFLGMRIDCLQCHDDMLGDIMLGDPDDPRDSTQRDFHQLAAFFEQAQSSATGIRNDLKAEYEYQFLDEEVTEKVDAEVPFLRELRVNDGPLREQLAQWVTHIENKPFARAAVNRVWALMLGKPLIEPIDSIPLSGPYPPAMETLAEDFVAHNFDLQRLVRIIAATDVFQRDSRADFEVLDKHEDHWAVFPLTRLRPEQMAGSLIQASSLNTIDANADIFAQLGRYVNQSQFIQRYGDTGEDEFADHGGTIPQRLLLMNGDLLHERTQGNPLLLNGPSRIAVLARNDKSAVEISYLVTFSRRPSEDELKHFTAGLDGKGGAERLRAIEDLYWVLLNSTEFSWNH